MNRHEGLKVFLFDCFNQDDFSSQKAGITKKRALTREYLVRATYSYLEKFATIEKILGRVLDRKIRRKKGIRGIHVVNEGRLHQDGP